MTAKQRALPPIPRTVWSPYGPVPVRIVPDLKTEDGEMCYGLWLPLEREIHLRKGMHRATAWLTLWHERTHMELQDCGAALTESQEEVVCNKIAEARVLEMRRG